MPRLRELVRRQTDLKGKARQIKKKSKAQAAEVSFPKQALESARDLGREKRVSEEIYKEALSLIKEILHGQTIKGRELKQLVTRIINRLLMKDVLLLSLVDRPTPAEDYLCAHSVNTCILAIQVGLGLGYNKSKLTQLGLAAILHDVGMFRVLDIVSQPTKLTSQEYSRVKEHSLQGAKLLSQVEDIDREMPQAVAGEHHERHDGRGYPQGLEGKQINEYARIVGLVDVYEALTHQRSYREKMQAHQALKKVVDGSGNLFHPEVVKGLINQLTIYPMGSLVELSSGEIARVATPNKGFLLRPVVNIIFDREGKRLAERRSIDLSREKCYHIKGPADERLACMNNTGS